MLSFAHAKNAGWHRNLTFRQDGLQAFILRTVYGSASESLFGHRDLLRFDLFARAEHTPPAELAQRIRSALCERNLALCGDATSPSLASFVG